MASPPGAPCPCWRLVTPHATRGVCCPVVVPCHPRASCPLSPWSSSEWHSVILGAFAHLSLHCDNVLSPEVVVTLCPLMGQRQTCDFWLLPTSMGRLNLGWDWGLPAWVGQQWGVPRASLKPLRVPSPHWEGGPVPQDGFGRSFCCAHPTVVALPPACSVSLHAWHHLVAPGSSVPSVPGRGAVSLVLCPFPPSWLLQRAPGQGGPRPGPRVSRCVSRCCP